MSKRLVSTYRSRMRAIYAQFMEARELDGRGDWPVDLDEVFQFARERDLWHPPKLNISQRFRSDMARSLREEYFTDNRNRTVRRYHAARYYNTDENGAITQQVFWADMLSTPPPPRGHMEVALQQRRQQVVGDCHQLKKDVDHYNERNDEVPPILMLWDFTYDVMERDQPTEYKSEPTAE
jgi:hypothetical protein